MLIWNFFTENLFLSRAIIACLAISFICPILGVFLMFRRMSLMGDAIGHAILPGVAVGYMFSGMSLVAMVLGGALAGVVVTALAWLVSQKTNIKEDASFAGFYLISLALGVIIISSSGTNLDLMHILFGSILAINHQSLVMLASVVSFSLIAMAVIIRPLVVDIFDPSFLRSVKIRASYYHLFFLFLVTINLVVDFQILGTILVVGLMMLPAGCGKLLANSLNAILFIAICSSIISSCLGIMWSYYYDVSTGPAIILTNGILYLLCIAIVVIKKIIVKPHYCEQK